MRVECWHQDPGLTPGFRKHRPERCSQGILWAWIRIWWVHAVISQMSPVPSSVVPRATVRQRELYQLAWEEISHNLALIRPGLSLSEFQKRAYVPAEEFHQNAYPCLIHGVGMSDEHPQVKPAFRGENPYDGVIEKDMVICVESYMGAVGEPDGVKLEQQVLVTKSGYELLSLFPLEAELMDA